MASVPLPTISRTPSFEYFEDDDPDFIDALLRTKLPGDLSESSQGSSKREKQPQTPAESLKRQRSASSALNPVQETDDYEAVEVDYDDTPSRLGHFSENMRKKRAKLQGGNAHSERADDSSSKIFAGMAIYVNGWTEPPIQVLRQLIFHHGGVCHAHLDKISSVTHIVACSLTPEETRKFKHMKVARPDWLVKSARSGKLLPWQDYDFRPSHGSNESQGIKLSQSPVRASVSQASPHPSTGCSTRQSITFDTSIYRTAGPHTDVEIGGRHRLRQCTPPRLERLPSPCKITFPLYTTDPATAEQASRVPSYATHVSNPNAERVMADPDWRAAHTSMANDFVENYYRNSRLHHLSMWKAELKSLVAEAQERAESNIDSTSREPIIEAGIGFSNGSSGEDGCVSMRGAELNMKSPTKRKEKIADDEYGRVIMHCDFDCFFVSAGLVSRPHLRGKPVVVCHSQGAQGGQASTSEIASCSYEARRFGIKNGMSLQQARKLCATIMTIPYEFERYKKFSLKFYTILMSHADDLQAVSVDEALIDVTNSVARIRAEGALRPCPVPDPAKELAESIRAEIKKCTACEVSIGIAHNILLARIATRRAKPAGSYHLLPADVQSTLMPLDIADLHGFGYSTRQKAEEKLGATSLGELMKKSKGVLCDALGKGTGETLYNAIRGIDDRKLESDKPRKSVSCEINYGIRFENSEQAEEFVYRMAKEVEKRLNEIRMHGRSVTLKLMKRAPSAPVEAAKFLGHGLCDQFHKQMPLEGPGGRSTSDGKAIGECAWRMLQSFNFDPKELRGIGIQVQKLELAERSLTGPVQAKLPFKATKNLSKSRRLVDSPSSSKDDLQIIIHPPSFEPIPKEGDGLSRTASEPALPSFSQVDKDVFDALPEDVRQELENEYKHRSMSPLPVATPTPVTKPKARITVKGTNFKRITQQLAPRNRPVMTAPQKNRLFNQAGPSAVLVSDTELRKLKIDPGVFSDLPVDVQREQLALARQTKARSSS